MKKLWVLPVLLAGGSLSGFVYGQQMKLTVSLAFSRPVKEALLIFKDGENKVRDSAQIVNGQAVFSEPMSGPTLSTIAVRFIEKEGEKIAPETLQVFLEPGDMYLTAKDSLQFAEIKGSKSNDDFTKLKALEAPYDKQGKILIDQYYAAQKVDDEKTMKEADQKYGELEDEKFEKVYLTFIKANPSSAVSLIALNKYSGYELDPAKVEPLFNSFSEDVRSSVSGEAFKKRIEKAKKTAIGAYAPEFTQADTLGNPVALSSFRGKYLLVDFWASWCGPCRAENPNVVKAYHEFKDKGFTILGVSLDMPGRKASWLDAIHKDNLTWTHVSDLKGWQNEAAALYNVQAVPSNFLINPEGKIIGKNLRAEDLVKKLEEVLPKS